MVRWDWVKLLVPGHPTNLDNIKQGSTVLSVGAGVDCLAFFSLAFHFFFFLSSADGPI